MDKLACSRQPYLSGRNLFAKKRTSTKSDLVFPLREASCQKASQGYTGFLSWIIPQGKETFQAFGSQVSSTLSHWVTGVNGQKTKSWARSSLTVHFCCVVRFPSLSLRIKDNILLGCWMNKENHPRPVWPTVGSSAIWAAGSHLHSITRKLLIRSISLLHTV